MPCNFCKKHISFDYSQCIKGFAYLECKHCKKENEIQINYKEKTNFV